MGFNEPEYFRSRGIQMEDVCEPEENKTHIEEEPIDWTKTLKSLSLGTSIIAIGSAISIKVLKFLSTVNIVLPRLPLEDWLLVFGIVALLPYVSISLYQRYKISEPKDKK